MGEPVKFYRSTGAKIASHPIENGALYFATDETKTFMDVGGERLTIYEPHNSWGFEEMEPEIPPFEWGDENAVGDAQWWADLKTWCHNSTTEERLACIGKTKKVKVLSTLDQCGWNANAEVDMVCIGSDIDADNSLSFQTLGVTQSTFTSGVNVQSGWSSSSYLVLAVDNFCNNITASQSILPIYYKMYSTAKNTTQANGAYSSWPGKKGWITSESEMSFIAGKHSAENMGYANSYAEFTKNRPQVPYPYYTDITHRIKHKTNNTGMLLSSIGSYYCRSLSTDSNQQFFDVCYVTYKGEPGTPLRTGINFAPCFVIG